jgi:flagellar hook-associated protein 3 FlgL
MLSSLERAMLENDGTALALRLKELDQALEQILKRQADIGNTVREFETAMQKIESQKFEQERRLSEIRDSDLAETVIEVKTAEANNRLALDTGSKLIQPTLSDFLR